MNASMTIARDARPTARSADCDVAFADRHAPVCTAAACLHTSRNQVGAAAEGAAQIPAVALRPSQIPAARPATMSPIQREQLRRSGAQSGERVDMARAAASVHVKGPVSGTHSRQPRGDQRSIGFVRSGCRGDREPVLSGSNPLAGKGVPCDGSGLGSAPALAVPAARMGKFSSSAHQAIDI